MADDLTTILRFVGDPSNAEAAINGLISSLQKAAKGTDATAAANTRAAQTSATFQAAQSAVSTASATVAKTATQAAQATVEAARSFQASGASGGVLVSVYSSVTAAIQKYTEASAGVAQVAGKGIEKISEAGRVQNFLAAAALDSGAKLESVQRAFTGYIDLLNAARGGSQNAANAIKRFGIDLNAAVKNPIASFPLLIQGFSGIEDKAKRLQALITAFGQKEVLGISSAFQALGTDLEGLTAKAATASTGLGEVGASAGLLANPVGIAVTAIAGLTIAIIGVTAAAFELTKNSAETGARLFDLADKTGLSIRNLDLFRRAALEAGKGLDVVERSFDQFTSRLEKGSQTTGQLADTIRSLGLDPKKSLDNVNLSLETVVKNLNAIENPAIRAAKAQEIFGLRNEAIIPILSRIGQSLEDYEKRAGGLGKITEEQAKASKQFDVSLNILSATVSGLAKSVGAELLPIFQATIDLIQTVVRNIGQGLLIVLGKSKTSFGDVADSIDVMNAVLRSTPAFINVLKAALSEAGQILGRFASVARDTAVSISGFATGNFALAIEGAASAVKGVQGLTAGLGDQTKRALGQAIAETGRQLQLIKQERAKLSVGGNKQLPETPDKTAGSALGGIKAEGEARLKLLQLQEKQAELSNRIQTDNLKIALDQRFISLQSFTEQQIRLEKELLEAKLITFAAENDLVIKNAEEETKAAQKSIKNAEARSARIQAIEAQKNLKLGEIQLRQSTAEADADKREVELRDNNRLAEEKAEIDHQNRMLEIRDVARKRAEDQIRDAAGLGAIGFVAAEQKLIEIERERFNERETILRRDLELSRENEQERERINDALIQLEEERTTASEEASRRIRDASTRELNDRISFLRNLTGAYGDLEKAQLDQTDAQTALAVQEGRLSQNNAALRGFEQRREALRLETQDRQQSIADQAAGLAQQAIQAQEGAARLVEIERLKTEALTAERQRAAAIEQQIQNEQLAFLQAIGGGIRGLFSARVNELANNLGLARGLIQNFVTDLQGSITPLDEIGSKAFQGFADGIGSAVSNFVLLGKTGPAVIRKVLAAQLAAIAQEATINAIKELALGFGALFLNPAEAAGHFTSAALWASIAGASAIVGRAIAPKEPGGAASSANEKTDSNGNRVIEQGGALPTAATNQITIRVVTHPDVTIERVQENVQNNGTLRTTLQQLAGATA